MKFSSIFTGLVATLAFTATAAPVANPDHGAVGTVEERGILDARVPLPEEVNESDPYYMALKGHLPSSLQNDKWYVLYDTTPRGQGDKMGDDAERVRDRLGYDHVKLVLAQYKETRTDVPPGKNAKKVRVVKKLINVKFYDLVVKDLKTEATDQRVNNWDPKRAAVISYKGIATKGSITAATNAGKEFLKANPTWGKCEDSHCGGYADYVWGKIK